MKNQLIMEEIWKDIEGYEGYYQVSNYGRIKSVERLINYKGLNKTQKYPSVILRQCLNTVGYYQVSLSINNNRRRVMAHRIVALAFCNRPSGRDFVNHIDGNYLNNDASNLEWLTSKENSRHAIVMGAHKVYGEDSHLSKFTNNQADIIRMIKNRGIKTSDLCTLLNVHKSCINRIVKGDTYNINNKIKTYKNDEQYV